MNEQYSNLEYLYEVADNEIEFVKEIITDYVTQVPVQFGELQLAVEKGDAESAVFLAHKLKSSFQFMGALVLVDLAKTMEDEGKHGHSDELVLLLKQMTPVVKAVLVELQQKLDSL